MVARLILYVNVSPDQLAMAENVKKWKFLYSQVVPTRRTHSIKMGEYPMKNNNSHIHGIF